MKSNNQNPDTPVLSETLAALLPFAKWAEEWPNGSWSNNTQIPGTPITVGQLRRARTLIAAINSQAGSLKK